MELKEKSKDYYKIVSVKDDKFYSIFIDDNSKVEYKLNKWAHTRKENKNKGYFLLVFELYENVLSFLKYFCIYHSHIKCKVFKCKIKNEINLPYQKEARFGIINWEWDCEIFPLHFPDGTIMAEKIKIYGEPIEI